jgi:hypothetical protein
MAKSASMLRMLAAVGLMAMAALGAACGNGSEQSKGSLLCRALDAKVPGVDTINWDNGYTSEESTWAGLLDGGILYGDRSTLEAAAVATRDASNGFDRVLGAAPVELRPALERLEALLSDPDAVVNGRNESAVLADIRAVTAATPPELCGWVR